MNTEKKVLFMDEYDQGIIIRALNELRNEQLQKGRTTDALDELILKTAYAQKKKFRMKGEANERG